MRRVVIASLCMIGCYTGAPATRDVSAAWRGRHRAEIEQRWGAPAVRGRDGTNAVLTWTHDNVHYELPSADASIAAHPVEAVGVVPGGAVVARATVLDVRAMFRPGEVWHTTTAAAALVDPSDTIERVDGASLRWGPPNDANLHWGTIFGLHVGMGRLDSTSTPLPSGGAYIGGMLAPTLGLVGTFSLAAGTGSTGGAMGFAWGVAAQWWPVNRLWVRAGPAMLLAFDPGFTNAALHPGVTTGASYAFVKVGTVAVDLRLDVSAGTSVAFGTVGVGVNLN